MVKKRYFSPLLKTLTPGGDSGSGSVVGEGTGQGSVAPEGMTYDEWWDEVAWGGDNPDADYNGDGAVDELDYVYYIENELWKG